MKVLGIDTSTSCGGVGLVDDERVISECLLNVSVTHSERLLATIEHLLKESGHSVEELDGWAVSLGPGSFTGLRIGVSTVKGLAFATQKPVAGVPTLDALASQVPPTPYLICPILDARKGEVYTAFYHYDERGLLKRESPYLAIGPQDLAKRIEEKTVFIGTGVGTYANDLKKALSSLALFPSAPLHLPRGSIVAGLGLELLRKGQSLDLASFTPIYVRPSEAEIKWKERHGTL
jgi:tRNA threonylcarbamoyladenosine biosynthesis protein TsaB